MESFLKDLRFSIRALLKRPGFSVVAALTLALGIAATTAIFSVVNAVLLEPLPVSEPDDLVVPDVISPSGFSISLSIPNFRDWSQRSRTFESWGASAGRWRTLTGGDRPEVIRIRLVLGEFFRTLGVSAALGRSFTGEETWEGAEPVALVTHGFWERRLGSDPDVLGSSITLDGQPYTIIGVMAPEFVFPSADTEVFLPMGFFSDQMCWEARGCSQGTWAIARLKADATLGMAQEDMDRLTREITEEEGDQQAVARLESLEQAYVGDVRTQIWILMGAVVFVLLIACANVASLLLARGESRRQEMALRMAIGAGRGRIVRQLLTESTVLALAGGLLGVVLAFVAVRLMIPRLPEAIPSVMAQRVVIDLNVLLFALVLALLTGVLFGLAPALRGSRHDLSHELKEGGRGGTIGKGQQRLRSAFVVVEVALALVLLIGAGLMIQSVTELQRVDKGFAGESVFTARVSLPVSEYTEKEQAWDFFDQLHERLIALPGSEAVSLSNIVPLQGNSWEQTIVPEGVPFDQEHWESVLFHMVKPGHFETLGIELVRGRAFTDADRDESPLVCVIDETMAEKFWPGEDPIGKRVAFEITEESDFNDPDPIYRTVIGVARNVRHYELENPSRVQVYVPFNQSGRAWSNQMFVLVKTRGDALQLTQIVREEVSALHPDVPLHAVQTMQDYVGEAMAGTRSTGSLLALFSAVALLLSGIGIFGVMSFSVVQRIREIGIRMALGASSADVLRLMTRHGLALGILGIGLGLVTALALTRLLAGLLYQVDPIDPATYAGFAAFLLAVALLATYLPAKRATRVDPAVVLREE